MTAAVIVILVNTVFESTAYRLVYQFQLASCLRPKLHRTSDLMPFLGSNSGKVCKHTNKT